MRRVSHAIERVEVTFDDPNLVANAGLILVGTLCVRLELERLVNTMVQLGQRVGGAKPGRKVLSLVHAIVAGGSHIDHADVLRSGGSAGVLPFRVMAPSTLGTFLRCFTFGHVRQLEAVIAETLRRAWALGAGPGATRLVISSSPRLADGVAALLSFCKGRHPDPVWEEMAKLDYSGDADAMRMWVAGQLPIADSLHRAGDGDRGRQGQGDAGEVYDLTLWALAIGYLSLAAMGIMRSPALDVLRDRTELWAVAGFPDALYGIILGRLTANGFEPFERHR